MPRGPPRSEGCGLDSCGHSLQYFIICRKKVRRSKGLAITLNSLDYRPIRTPVQSRLPNSGPVSLGSNPSPTASQNILFCTENAEVAKPLQRLAVALTHSTS